MASRKITWLSFRSGWPRGDATGLMGGVARRQLADFDGVLKILDQFQSPPTGALWRRWDAAGQG